MPPACASAATPTLQPVSGAVTINIAQFKFAPEALTVKAGAKVTWVNADAAPHTATASEDTFDTGTLKKGAKSRR